MKRFLSLTLIAIMLFSTLTLTSCVLPKGLQGGFIDMIHNIAAAALGEYEINEAEWEKAMSQTNYTVQWNISFKDDEYLPWLEYSHVQQTADLRCETSRNEYKTGNIIGRLYAKKDDVYYVYDYVLGEEIKFQGSVAHHSYTYCLGYHTQSPMRTLAQETFLEGVKFEDLEFDGLGRYYYKTTLFGEEVEYVFEFRFGSLYSMRAGGLISAYHIGVTEVYDDSNNADLVDKKLD